MRPSFLPICCCPVEPMGLRLEFVAGMRAPPSTIRLRSRATSMAYPTDRTDDLRCTWANRFNKVTMGASRTCAGGGIRGRTVYAGQLHRD